MYDLIGALNIKYFHEARNDSLMINLLAKYDLTNMNIIAVFMQMNNIITFLLIIDMLNRFLLLSIDILILDVCTYLLTTLIADHVSIITFQIVF